VQPPAFVLERHAERIETLPGSEIGRRRRGLDLADLFDQHLPIVQAAEQFLIAAQDAQVRRQPGVAGDVMFELDGVTPEIAREAFELAAAKLPIGTRFVSRQAEEVTA